MPSMTFSRRILGCLSLVILLSQCVYGKSKHLEPIKTSLQRIETLLVDQAEKSVVNCVLPIEQLYNLIDDLSTSLGQNQESNEILSSRRSLENYLLKQLLKKKRRQSYDSSDDDNFADEILNLNTAANTNANVNTNVNTNANQLHSRRTLSSKLPSFLASLSNNLNTNQNTNFNSNLNVNKNKAKYDSNESDY